MSNKGKIGIGIFIIVICFGVYQYVNKEIQFTNYPSNGSGVLAIGDSLVEGVGSQNDTGFVGPLASLIREPIKNYGKSGDTTAQVLERLPEILSENPNPQVVILLAGGNDYLRKVPPEQTFENLGMIIDQIHKTGAVVLLLGIRGGAVTDKFEDNFNQLAKEKNTAYVPDVLSGVFARSQYMFDAIHPNDVGYKKIAQRIYGVLVQVTK